VYTSPAGHSISSLLNDFSRDMCQIQLVCTRSARRWSGCRRPIGHDDFAGFTNCSGLCQRGIWPILTYPLSAFERFASIHLLQDNTANGILASGTRSRPASSFWQHATRRWSPVGSHRCRRHDDGRSQNHRPHFQHRASTLSMSIPRVFVTLPRLTPPELSQPLRILHDSCKLQVPDIWIEPLWTPATHMILFSRVSRHRI
jgi:hypothetical protein